MRNRLMHETSPYLLQHAENPVQWYPWCEEAFRRAKEEDKPVFLSIGYSTCHWCHVMAHESFEDEEIAELLNRHFIAVKVDKEERPDIDSIYMAVCQAFTGSGGWPTSIFMTPDQQPFFAGTYFPKQGWGGMMGLREILIAVHEAWNADRPALISQAKEIVAGLGHRHASAPAGDNDLPDTAVAVFSRIYDSKYGGFGRAPKFPTPHHLLFLLAYHQRYDQHSCLEMAEHTLQQMYRGGLFDHIGFGFCRYSTDKQFLVPHFEKMLYDNALLILAYCRAHETAPQTGLYLEVAEKTADYILREMTAPEGGFFSAQDADSEGEEGKYYLFTPDEITALLGEQAGEAFNRHYDITATGNFEGKNIPNLLHSDPADQRFAPYLDKIAAYRKTRYALHLDDKILTAWNGLMIAAMCSLYHVSGKTVYRDAAARAEQFIRKQLCQGDTLFVSFRDGKCGVKGFLDDYAAFILAQLALYSVTLEAEYLDRAQLFCEKVLREFGDPVDGGFYFTGTDSEELILRPKETYDGAMPSGNSLMAYNLVRLWHLTSDPHCGNAAERQLAFLSAEAAEYPTGHSMFLLAQLEYAEPPIRVTVVPDGSFNPTELLRALPADALVIRLEAPTEEYSLKDGKTTFYICRNRSCLPPVNDWKDALQI